MIGDPVALTIRRKIKRPPKSLVGTFAGAETSFIADAQNGKGALHHRIKPLTDDMRFCGVAVTAANQPHDLLANMAMLDFVQPGDVLMIATGGDESAAVIGDNYAAAAKLKGVAAMVTDGLMRDRIGILEADIPAFCVGMSPNSGFQNGPGEINTSISIGGVVVDPGDIIVGDLDGVMVIKRQQARAVAASLAKVAALEKKTRAAVLAGRKTQFWNPAAFKERGITYLD